MIPDTAFNHRKSQFREFELIDLHRMYQQRDQLGQPPHQPHRLKFYNLLYVRSGAGQHMVDLQMHTFKPGSLILVQPNQIQAFDFSSPVAGKLLLFTQAFLDQVHANMRLPSFTPTHLTKGFHPLTDAPPLVTERLDMLLRQLELESDHPDMDALIVMHLFSALFLLLHRENPGLCHTGLSESRTHQLGTFMSLLKQEYTHQREAEWYANQMHTTYKTLNQLCKQATGQTAKQLINAYTILEAKRRLVISGIQVQQLSYELGFEDASNFIKYFKKLTGITPKQFRLTHHQNS
ncbi:AraC family transcriptional regulator [Shewanella sp. GXUN23E]|uniref:AraC family transcriptional regulator n=1 Tax=Shewanella sp. GXUN23E TaxID=3422498 RepID=UPI003D7E4924